MSEALGVKLAKLVREWIEDMPDESWETKEAEILALARPYWRRIIKMSEVAVVGVLNVECD